MSVLLTYQFLSNKQVSDEDILISHRRLDAALRDNSFNSRCYLGATFPSYIHSQQWGVSSIVDEQLVLNLEKGYKSRIVLDQRLNFTYQLSLNSADLISLKHIVEEVTSCYYYLSKILQGFNERLQYKVYILGENLFEAWLDYQGIDVESPLANWRFVNEQYVKVVAPGLITIPTNENEAEANERNKDLIMELIMDFAYNVEGRVIGTETTAARLKVVKNNNLKSIIESILSTPQV